MRIDNYRGWADEALPVVGADGELIPPTPPTFDAATSLLGVDISHYQNDVDFAKLKASGCAYVFIKATEGVTIVDAKFSTYRAGAKAVGLPRGFYHFFRPKSDAKAQADAFCKAVGSLEPGDLPPVMDVEVPADWTGFTVAQRNAMIQTFLDAVEKTLGVRPIVYINNPMTTTTLGNPSYLKNYILWVAHYTSKAQPSVPLPWTSYTFWQYTETGTIGGITGACDLNRFAGTLADLQRLQKGGGVTSARKVPAPAGFFKRLRRGIGRLLGCSRCSR